MEMIGHEAVRSNCKLPPRGGLSHPHEQVVDDSRRREDASSIGGAHRKEISLIAYVGHSSEAIGPAGDHVDQDATQGPFVRQA